jgi:uncharacterized membrane protein
MKNNKWFIPILIVAVNALMVIVKWSSLPELLPAHFDLQGNASGTMSRSMLPLYPAVSGAVCVLLLLIAIKAHRLKTGLIVLSSGISLILLCSTMVTLTTGKMPVFMLAEPVILVAAVIGFIICLRKSVR